MNSLEKTHARFSPKSLCPTIIPCDKLLLFDDLTENAGFVHFNDRSIQPELIKQLNKLVTTDSGSSKTVLAHNFSITSLVLIYFPYKTKQRLLSKPFQTGFPYFSARDAILVCLIFSLAATLAPYNIYYADPHIVDVAR